MKRIKLNAVRAIAKRAAARIDLFIKTKGKK